MKLEAYIVNSFTEELASGNPAGVVFYDDGELADELFLKLAVDMGKSETAFVRRARDGAYSIRWFSPRREMPLCGHATLAAAKVMFEMTGSSSVAFASAAGEVPVERRADGSVSMRFPLDEYDQAEADAAYDRFFPGIAFEECIIGRKTGKVVLLAPADADLAMVEPDFGTMRKSRGVFDRGIGISKPSRAYDFESRYFNPWAGVDEDPVTGSVHTVLAGYWGRRLGKRKMMALQASYRPGALDLELDGGSVRIAGKARIVFSGTVAV
jgi:PhzF family phenazine biosynthesis protein